MTDNPSQHELDDLASGFTTLAVTGTNGKTSTTSMLAEIVRAAGQLPVRVTTLGMWVGDEQLADDTSMGSFLRCVRRAREQGAHTLALELTSRALEAGFAARWPAHVAVFTNLTHDHLDRHGTPERYLAAKAQLFLHLRAGGSAVVNAADPASALLAEVLPASVRGVGYLARPGPTATLALELGLAVEQVAADEHGSRVELTASPLARRLGGTLQLRALGDFQVDNALAAALAAAQAGFDADAIARGLARFGGVPGRLEVVSRAPLVLLDFAHSPDALARALSSARSFAVQRGARLACVFGCGGERDSDKRPRMGELADRLADAVWLTTDNPRSEPPDAIAAMVRAGARGQARWHEVPDRRAAIGAALDWARAEDVVVVAGRGDESHQQLAHGRMLLRDRDVVDERLSARR